MKKTLIAVAAAAALTTSAFAEITFGSWGRAIAVPVASNGKDTVAGQTQSWGGAGRTTGLTVRGQDADGVSGFTMDIRAETTGTLTGGDEANFWFKPIDTVKVTLGKRDFCPLRSNIGLPVWGMMRPAFISDDGVTFDCSTTLTGLYVEANPTDALYAYVAAPLVADNWSDTAFEKAEDNYKKVVAAAAYTIDGVGKVKVGFDGSKYTKDAADKKYTGNVNAAFDLTSVENLVLSVGVNFPIVDKELVDPNLGDAKKEVYNGCFADTKIGVEVAYQVSDELRVAANATIAIATTKTDAYDKVNAGMLFGFGATYNLGDGLKALADVRYLGERKNDSVKLSESQVAALVGLEKQFGAASVATGFEVVTNVAPGAQGLKGLANADAADKKTVWAIPVVISMGL